MSRDFAYAKGDASKQPSVAAGSGVAGDVPGGGGFSALRVGLSTT